MREISVCVGSARREPLTAVRLVFPDLLSGYQLLVQPRCSKGSANEDPYCQSLERLPNLLQYGADYTLSFGSKVYRSNEAVWARAVTLIKGPFGCVGIGMARAILPEIAGWQSLSYKDLQFAELPTELYRDAIARAVIPHRKYIDDLAYLL